MKVTKNYEEALELLTNLPNNIAGITVLINHSTDNVEIHYYTCDGQTPYYVKGIILQYIEDIKKAIRKEHEVPLETVDTSKEVITRSYSFKGGIQVLKQLYDVKFNEFEINIHPDHFTITSKQDNDDLPYIPKDGVKMLIDEGIVRIEEAQKELDQKKIQLQEELKQSPLPKVKDFFEGLLSKLDEIDMLPIETIREKAEQLLKEQAYDKWNDSTFGQSVIEMKKLLESLDSITEDSFFEKIKSKVQSFNRQVIALSESRKELEKILLDLPNKEKFSINYDNCGFVDIVQVPSVSFIKTTGLRFVNSDSCKIDGFVYERQEDGSYIEVLECDMKNVSIKFWSTDSIIIAEERVPFNRFTITKSGIHTFAVEVIDKPVI